MLPPFYLIASLTSSVSALVVAVFASDAFSGRGRFDVAYVPTGSWGLGMLSSSSA
jgi:hypothetical protein